MRQPACAEKFPREASLGKALCPCVCASSTLFSPAIRLLLNALLMLRHACRSFHLRPPLIVKRHSRPVSRRVSTTAGSRTTYGFTAYEESATQRLAALLASDLRAGDCYCLFGDVGAGKSVFRWVSLKLFRYLVFSCAWHAIFEMFVQSSVHQSSCRGRRLTRAITHILVAADL